MIQDSTILNLTDAVEGGGEGMDLEDIRNIMDGATFKRIWHVEEFLARQQVWVF